MLTRPIHTTPHHPLTTRRLFGIPFQSHTKPKRYEPPIDTAHDLAAHNMEWGATQAAWVFSILLATQVRKILCNVKRLSNVSLVFYVCTHTQHTHTET